MKIDKYILLIALIFTSCENSTTNDRVVNKTNDHRFEVKGLTDEEYPDNPDIGFMANGYMHHYIKYGKISSSREGRYELTFYSDRDSISLNNLDLLEFMPSLPSHLREDEYLKQVAVINQEYNRNQVNFSPDYFQTTNPSITRVDVARNCLASYLWEVIIYTDENGKELPLSHGWFNFPKQLYADLFLEKNGESFEQHSPYLEDWVDLENKPVNFSLLRRIVDTISISFEDKSDKMYPLAGARKKKYKEIVHPPSFQVMNDLQSDSTLFATFSPPGFYNRADPRKTQLGRFVYLESVQVYQTITPNSADSLFEIEMIFSENPGNGITKFYLGGLELATMPILDESDANKGWKNSMGFSNHTFYETYEEHINWSSGSNPYYAFLTDGQNNWLDSHLIGIDGPVLFWDKTNSSRLHLWLLSFERHAFVGHYIIDFIEGKPS